jgi:hypothetical protein
MKLMNHIVEGLGVIGVTLSGDFAKVVSNGDSTKVTVIKARLLNFFTGKETKTKEKCSWLHQIEAYMETQHLKSEKD